MSPWSHSGCSVLPVRMNNVKNDARGNGVSSRSRVLRWWNVSGGSGGFHPAPAALVDGVRAPGPVSGNPGAVSLISAMGNPARRRTSCRKSVYVTAESRRFRRFCNSTRLYINRGRTVKGKLGFSQGKSGVLHPFVSISVQRWYKSQLAVERRPQATRRCRRAALAEVKEVRKCVSAEVK